MMQAQVIAAYKHLLEQSRRILECAENADWDGIFTLKSQGLIDAAYLRRAENQTTLDAGAQEQKLELMSQILELDCRVNQCLRARQDDLAQLMQVNRRKSDLNQAYQIPGHNVIPMSLHLYQKKQDVPTDCT